ncbi:MAG: hypothetical protein EHM87_00160 [Burkholderiales bacterium]|nr:MAG: hypothetical protein EHM87_00160 [Burkholderiales bacterium]
MTRHRTGLALAVVAFTALPACTMWNNMTDRMTGRSPSAETASGNRGTMGTRGTMGGTQGGSAQSGGTLPGSGPTGGTSPGSAPMGGASAGSGSPGGAPMGSSATGSAPMGGGAASGGSYANTPGGSMTTLRGGPTTAGASLPAFRSYSECKAWEAGQRAGTTALNRGPMQGGEVTLADQDLCARFPRS